MRGRLWNSQRPDDEDGDDHDPHQAGQGAIAFAESLHEQLAVWSAWSPMAPEGRVTGFGYWLVGLTPGNERDVELAGHVDGQVAEIDVDPVARALDLGEGVDQTGESLEDAVEPLLVGRQRLDGVARRLDVLVEAWAGPG